jgi:phosphatidylserine/phosphatidylglycerophosphate/cardiolipin synthase-like enzyme
MKKLVHPLVALVILALGAFIVSPAQAKAYMPAAGATFNNPLGSRSDQTVLMRQIIEAVNNVPKGSIIRIVAYSFDYDDMANALINAHDKNGAQVRLLIDSHTETAQIRRLRSALGTGTSDGSYLRTCKYSCMANKSSFIHSKLYMFSRTGDATRVVMNSSANPAETGVSRSWNNTYTTVGDKTIYDANVDNFNGATSTVRLTTYFWTSARLYLAQKLSAMKRAGCTIQVIYPDGPGSQDTIYSQITSELRSGAIDTWNTRPRAGLYVHNKVILIDGTYQGVGGQKLVYTTSQNLTLTSLRESNEVMLRIPNVQPAYNQYVANFEQIKSQSEQIIGSAAKTTAKTTAGVESTSEKRSSKAPKDNSPDPDE